jgi:hypothetical protein
VVLKAAIATQQSGVRLSQSYHWMIMDTVAFQLFIHFYYFTVQRAKMVWSCNTTDVDDEYCDTNANDKCIDVDTDNMRV